MTLVYNETQVTTFLDQIFWRLRLLEAQLTLTARELGMRHHDAASMTPAELVDLLVRATERGDTSQHRTTTDTRHTQLRPRPRRRDNHRPPTR
jgi:hypothetical protein